MRKVMSRRAGAWWSGRIGVAAALAAAGCGPSAAREADSEGEAAAAAVNVEVRRLEPAEFVDRVRVTGEVEAEHDLTLSAEEAGVVVRFEVPKGAVVRVGQTVARIDDRLLRAQVEETRAQARLARERYERQRQLWEEEGIGSEIAFLERRYEAEAAEARLTTLETRLARTRIASPADGVVDERFVEAGERVEVGQPVARVVQVERLKVVGGVPERYAGRVRPGQEVEVTFDVLPGRRFDGVVRFVAASVEPASRTFRMEVQVENPERTLKPGMIAGVSVPVDRREGVIAVPQEVIQRVEDGYRVLVAEEGTGGLVAVSRRVRPGPSADGRTVVEEGLRPGDLLVVRGFQLADPGDRLRVVEEGAS